MDKLIEYLTDTVETQDFQIILNSAISEEVTISKENPAISNAAILVEEATKSVSDSSLDITKDQLLKVLEVKKNRVKSDPSQYPGILYRNINYLAFEYAFNLDVLVSYRNHWPQSPELLTETIAQFSKQLISDFPDKEFSSMAQQSGLSDKQLEEHYIQIYLQYQVSSAMLNLPYLYSNIKETIDTYPLGTMLTALNFEIAKKVNSWMELLLNIQ